jgi:EF hand
MAQVANPPRPDPTASPQATFESLDRNKDQRVSKEEAAAADGLASQFATLDSDADGYINKGEYLRMRQ